MRVTTPAVSADTRSHLHELSAEIVTDEQGLLELEGRWNALARSAAVSHPFLSHAWVRTSWECFGASRGRLHVIVLRDAGEVVAIAPLMLTTVRMLGVPTRRLEFIGNVHTPRFDLLIGRRGEEAYRAIWEVLARDRGWDVLMLCQLPAESPTVSALRRLATADGFRSGLWDAPGCRYLPLVPRWEESLKAKHRSNLRNRLNRLEKLGEVDLQIVSRQECLKDALDDGFHIEAAAWKGAQGTAIASDPDVRRFYTRLGERMADHGWLRLQFLRLNGRRIAFGYSLACGNALLLLKTGYDPEYRLYSPGHLLMWQVLRNARREGVREFDFLGADASWHADWTTHVRPHVWLFVFGRGPWATLMHAAKFRLLPMLRRRRSTQAALHAASTWTE